MRRDALPEIFSVGSIELQWDKDSALQARYEDGRDDGIEIGRDDGIKIGRDDGIKIVALNMIRKGMPFENIREFTSLSTERLEELADSLKDSKIEQG